MNYPEFKELVPTEIVWPAGSEEEKLEYLKRMRSQLCETQGSFTLQSHQRFLRRILSPDSPLRNLLMVHGTGVGKTCTAIQVAEEYILRPEYQDKKVFIVASRAVEENFRKEIFDIQRVNIDTISGTLESQQCTGRRYLDMLLRIEREPRNWNNPIIRSKLEDISKKLINEFYEFSAYQSFGNIINEKLGGKEGTEPDEQWIHDNFDNRLVIIDEAHNIREGGKDTEKAISKGLRNLVNIAEGMVFVCLTATPMFDSYEEIMFYMNLFFWNDRRQASTAEFPVSQFFNNKGVLKKGKSEQIFRDWVSDYVSFVKGENPFTFPFRLPPPRTLVKEAVRKDFYNKDIGPQDTLQYLSLVDSEVQGHQRDYILLLPKKKEPKKKENTNTNTAENKKEEEEDKITLMEPTVAVLPDNKKFTDYFSWTGKGYEYRGEPCLTPETIGNTSAKFKTVIQSIEKGKGVCFVYSNYVTMGAKLFAMALEEHGYETALGKSLLTNSSYEGPKKGKYILLTSESSDTDISKMLKMVKADNNRDGSQVRVIISSPIVSEGVDFKFVRQIHILDPWWNMSRIEQVIGRGLRTCSHKLLPFEEQNCSVYLHVIRTGTGRECFDEYKYRTTVVDKAVKIARIRKLLMESAMDCEMQKQINNMPEDWKQLRIPQIPSEGGDQKHDYHLVDMLAPDFMNDEGDVQCVVKQEEVDEEHQRPLSTYMDVRDELIVKLSKLLIDKPIWDREQLLTSLQPYSREVSIFNLQQLISTKFRFKDSFGRPSVLESKGDLYALSPINDPNDTMVERTTQPPQKGKTDIPQIIIPMATTNNITNNITENLNVLDEKREAFVFPGDAKERLSKEVLNGYIFDHELTIDEKRQYIRARSQDLPFLDRLHVPGTDYYVLGEGVFEPPEPPVGDDKVAYDAWNKQLLDGFIANKNRVYASMNKSGKFTISKMEIQNNVPVRVIDKTGKVFIPIVCGTGTNKKDVMEVFAKYIDVPTHKGVPMVQPNPKKGPKEMTGPEFCIYIELLAREEQNVIWYTPEELSVLFDNTQNRNEFTKAFRK